MPLALVVALVAVVVHLTSLFGAFHYDDITTVLRNPSIPRADFLGRFFYEPEHFSGVVGSEMYRPVLLVTYQLDWHLYGYEGEAGWHLTNVLLHALCAALVVLATRRVFRVLKGGDGDLAPVLAGLCFALHPIQTEVVNYISSRSGAIATAGFLGALLAYLAATRGQGGIARRTVLTAASLLLFLLGLGGKELAIALVPTVLLLELLDPANGPAARRIGRAALRGLPILVTAIAYLVWRHHVLGEDLVASASRLTIEADRRDLYSGGGRTVFENLLTQARVFWMYVGLLVFPVNLAVDRFVRVSTSLSEPAVLASIAGIVVVIGALLSQWRRRPAITFAGFLVFFGLAPTSSLIPLNVVMNEHRMYLPCVGVAMLAGLGGAHLVAWRPKSARWVLGAVGVAFLALATMRNLEWRSSETLWEANLRVAPDSYRAHAQLADVKKSAANRMGRVPAAVPLLDEALASFERASELYPKWSGPWYGRGMVLINRAMITRLPEDWDRALEALERSCELSRTKPRQSQLWIAHAYGLRGDSDRAVKRYLELSEEERDERGHRTALYLLPAARVLAAQEKSAEAERLYRELMETQPKDPSAYAELAQLLARADRAAEAQAVIDALLAGPVRRPRAHLAAAWFNVRDRQPPDATAAARQFELAVEHGHRATDRERGTFQRPPPR